MSDSDHIPAPKLDPETLAAFLDGRLSGEERARVLEILAESEEDYEAFVEALHVTRTLQESEPGGFPAGGPSADRDEGPAAPGGGSPGAWVQRLSPPRALAAAAVLVMVAVGTWFYAQRGAGADAAPQVLVAHLDADLSGLPGWDQPLWRVRRSAEADLAPGQRAFRLGVRHAQLEAAARAGNREAHERLTGDLAALAGVLPGGGPLSALYRRVGELPPGAEDAARLRRDSWRALDAAAPTAELRLGAWAGAARIALLAGDVRWFETSAARESAEAVDEDALDPDTRRAWQDVKAHLNADPLNLEELRSALTALAPATSASEGPPR